MDATRLRFLASAVLLLATFLWTNCADAKPPQAPPVRKCLCPSCDCFTCFCKSGECRCAGCTLKKSGDSFNSGDAVKADLPTRLVLVTATAGWCPACERMHPAWAKVAAANPDVCEQIDIDASADFCRSLGIRQVPTLLLMQGDRKVYAWPSKVYARNQIEWMVGKARDRR